MKKINYCPSADYDFYTIKFPLRALNAELGKLHPCFSDDCSFDSHLRLDKSGLMADVLVMQKFKLAEYKKSNGQRPVFIKEKERLAFFGGNKKRKLFGFILSSLLLLLIIFLPRVFRAFSKKNMSSNESSVQSQVFLPEKEWQTATDRLIALISSSGGFITSFEYKIEGFNEIAKLGVKNIYPETIAGFFPQALFSPLVFEQSLPFFTVEIISKICLNQSQSQNQSQNQNQSQTEASSSVSDSFELRKEFRSFLIENNYQILEESIKPYSLKIQFLKNKGQEKNQESAAFKTLFDFIEKNGLWLKSLSLIPADQTLNFSIIFSETSFDFQKNLYKSLKENTDIFFKSIEADKSTVQKTAAPRKTFSTGGDNKIGQLLKADGTIIEFYKDKNGKIIQKIQNNNQEK